MKAREFYKSKFLGYQCRHCEYHNPFKKRCDLHKIPCDDFGEICSEFKFKGEEETETTESDEIKKEEMEKVTCFYCDNPADTWCWKCGVPLCSDHAQECIECGEVFCEECLNEDGICDECEPFLDESEDEEDY